jgi:hypothetical protein
MAEFRALDHTGDGLKPECLIYLVQDSNIGFGQSDDQLRAELLNAGATKVIMYRLHVLAFYDGKEGKRDWVVCERPL